MTNRPGPIRRRALMVERVGGPLSNLTPVIQKLGCEVARAAEAQIAIKLASTVQQLSLVAVNADAIHSDVRWLTTTLKAQHPDLPLLLLSTNPTTTAVVGKMDLVTSDLKKLEARISCLLREEFYSAAFVQQLVAGIRTVLVDFGMPMDASEPCVKSTLTPLGEVNAFLSVTGPRVAAHVVLSASASDLTVAYRARFPKIKFPDMDDLEDLLGEIANQVIGQIKRTLQSEGTDCRLGLPHFIRGRDASVRHKGGTPSLSIDFAGEKQKVHVDLCVHRFDGGGFVESSGADHLNPGVVNFF